MTKFIYKSKKIISFLLVLLIFFSNTFSYASISLVGGSALLTKALSTISLSIGATYLVDTTLNSVNNALYSNNTDVKSLSDNINNNYEYDSTGNIVLKEGASGIEGSKIENGLLYVPTNATLRNSARSTVRETYDITTRINAKNKAEEFIAKSYNESTGLYNSKYKYAYYFVASRSDTKYPQILFVAFTSRPDFKFYCYDNGYGSNYPCYYGSSVYPIRAVCIFSVASTGDFTYGAWETTASNGVSNYQGTFSYDNILYSNCSVINTGCVGSTDATNNFKTPFSAQLQTETADSLVGVQSGTAVDTDYPNVSDDEEEDESIDWFPIPPEDYSIDNYSGKTYDELINDINDTYGNTSEDTEIDTPSDKVIDETDYSIPESVTLDFSPLMLAGSTLTEKFPFCLPWDLYNCFSNLQAEETVPKFEVNFDEEYFVGGGTLTLDFEVFEPLVDIVHWGTLVLFVISLIFATKKIIGGGS